MAYMKAKVAYTYGWSDEQMTRMKYDTFLDYWIAITVIESEAQLLNIEAACAHIVKKSAREKMISRYRRGTRNSISKTTGRLGTIQDVAKAFARMQHG